MYLYTFQGMKENHIRCVDGIGREVSNGRRRSSRMQGIIYDFSLHNYQKNSMISLYKFSKYKLINIAVKYNRKISKS